MYTTYLPPKQSNLSLVGASSSPIAPPIYQTRTAEALAMLLLVPLFIVLHILLLAPAAYAVQQNSLHLADTPQDIAFYMTANFEQRHIVDDLTDENADDVYEHRQPQVRINTTLTEGDLADLILNGHFQCIALEHPIAPPPVQAGEQQNEVEVSECEFALPTITTSPNHHVDGNWVHIDAVMRDEDPAENDAQTAELYHIASSGLTQAVDH